MMSLHDSYKWAVNGIIIWVNWSIYVAIVVLDSGRVSDFLPLPDRENE